MLTWCAGAVAAKRRVSTARAGGTSSQGARARMTGAKTGCMAAPHMSAPVTQSRASCVLTRPGWTATAKPGCCPAFLWAQNF